MIAPAISIEDELVLDLWLDLLEKNGALVCKAEVLGLYLYGKDQGFFPSIQDAFTTNEWRFLGEHLLGLFTADCSVDLLRLVVAWKQFDLVLRGFYSPSSEISKDACSFLGEFFEPELEGEDRVFSEPEADRGLGSLGLAWAPPRPVPVPWHPWCGEGELLSLCSSMVLGGDLAGRSVPPCLRRGGNAGKTDPPFVLSQRWGCVWSRRFHQHHCWGPIL